MSVETEVKKVEGEVVAEAKAVEGEVRQLATETVAAVEERVRVEIEAVEKLVLRDAETEFLRAQVQIRDLQSQIKDASQVAEKASKKYSDQIEVLVKKYSIDKAKMVFDNIENVFKKTGK